MLIESKTASSTTGLEQELYGEFTVPYNAGIVITVTYTYVEKANNNS